MPTMKPKKETLTKGTPQNPLETFRKVFSEVPSPKGGLPTMPTRIADIASDELGNLIARYTAWREYAEDRHLEACAVYAQVKSEYDLANDLEMLRSDSATITEKKASAKNSPEVTRLYKRLNEAQIYMDLFARKLDSFSNVLMMLSRELTRRGVEFGK